MRTTLQNGSNLQQFEENVNYALAAYLNLPAQLPSQAAVQAAYNALTGVSFTLNGESFRSCLDCGAHRKFDTARWEMKGAYYYSLPQRQQ